MATAESEIHQRIKDAMVAHSHKDTTHILRSLRNTARVFKNSVSEQVRALEKQEGVEFSKLQPLVSGARGRKVYEEGDKEAGIWTAGQVLGLINDIPSCRELVQRTEREAEERIAALGALVHRPHL